VIGGENGSGPDLGRDGRIILKGPSKILDGADWFDLVQDWHKLACSEHGNAPSGSIQCGEFHD
jgi:hypothetical protein